MIHLVFGLGDDLAAACARVVAAARTLTGRTVATLRADTLPALAQGVLRENADDHVFLVEAADDGLWAAATARRTPALLAVGDPAGALAARVQASDAPAFHAFTHVLGACVTLDAAARLDGALAVTSAGCAANPRDAIARIAAHVGAPLEAGALAALTAAEGPLLLEAITTPDPTTALDRVAIAAGSVERARAMFAALEPYAEGGFRPAAGPHVLGWALFADGTPAHAPLGPVIDVTGPARFLTVGPGLRLPPGDWDARFVLDVSPAAAEGLYKVDVAIWSGGRFAVLAEAVFTAAVPGPCAVTLSFRHRSLEGALQYRLLSERAIFDGAIAFREVTLHPRP